jgi:hypothetical protein
VATAQISGQIAEAAVAGATTLFWTESSLDTNNVSLDTNSVFDLSLYSSSLDAESGQWSPAQLFTAGINFAAAPATAAAVQPALATALDLSGALGSPPTNCCPTNKPPPPPPPPPTNCPTCDTNNTRPVNSEDPNGKIGPAGYGSANWVLANAPFLYTIDFENATNATAPAQNVSVSDPLSTNFDWTTFQLAGIGFGSVILSVPPNSQLFETNVLMTYENVLINVNVNAGIDLGTGNVTVKFTSTDASTGLAPPVNAGFLPPEDGTGRGEGYVSFFIQPKAGLPQGAQITNVAFITFDENPVIATDQANDEDASQGIDTNKVVLVTIDDVPPASAVGSLPASSTTNFTVCWSGTNNGPAIAGYDIYVSTNNGPWSLWLSDTTNTCAGFTGQPGNSYGFYSIAYDEAGNAQAAPAAAQAATSIPAIVPAEIRVRLGAIPIANGQTNPVSFGSVGQGLAGPSLVFTVTNAGGLPLTLTSITVPPNYALNPNFPSTIGVAGSGSFSVQLNSSAIGVFSGDITISNNDPVNGVFAFPVTGTVTSLPTDSIALIAAPAGGGTVAGGGTFAAGSTNTVTASAGVGYIFDNWTAANGTVLSVSSNYTFVLAANETLTAHFITNAITISGGSLQVTLSPQGAIAAGAQWRVDSRPWQGSGATAGAHTLSFKAVSNWNAPTNRSVGITEGAATKTTGVYSIMETDEPELAITSPQSGQIVTANDAVLTLTGTTRGGERVTNVCYQINGGAWTAATPGKSWAEWTGAVVLRGGTNVISAWARDILGHGSATNQVVVRFYPAAPLVVEVAPGGESGSVSPYANGQLLGLGTNFTLTALPNSPNWIFSNWVAGGSEHFISNTPRINFTMQPNLILQANFVSNWFLAAQGIYNGLIAPESAPRRQTNSGAFTLDVTGNGAFLCKMVLGLETNVLAGQFDAGGKAEVISTPSRYKPLTTALQLNLAGQSVQGTVSDGSFLALLNGDQAVFSATRKATNFQGQYTLIIPGSTNRAVGPFGTSYGDVAVDALGNITFVGSLADGSSPVSQSSVVSKDGYWPFYVPLYGGIGSLWGWNYFTNHSIVSAPVLSWINPANSTNTALYRAGFTNGQATVIGSFYNSNDIPPLRLTNWQVTLDGGNLPFAIFNQINWATNNAITVPHAAENTNGLTLTNRSATGVISGSFLNPANAKQTIKISGIVLQNQTNAQGFFLGTNASGAFWLMPK